jgi:hypothetical protein
MRRGLSGVVVVLPVVGVHAGASLAGNDCSDASPIGSSSLRDGSTARRRPLRWRRWSISDDAHQASAPLPRISASPATDRRRRPKIRNAPAAVASSQRSASQSNRSSARSQMLSLLLCSSRFIAMRLLRFRQPAATQVPREVGSARSMPPGGKFGSQENWLTSFPTDPLGSTSFAIQDSEGLTAGAPRRPEGPRTRTADFSSDFPGMAEP